MLKNSQALQKLPHDSYSSFLSAFSARRIDDTLRAVDCWQYVRRNAGTELAESAFPSVERCAWRLTLQQQNEPSERTMLEDAKKDES
jgi:hypothetical protein